MTVTLTYDGNLARVRITANALVAADYATIERSTDQIIWTTVRGGVQVPLTGGSMVLPGTAGNYASTPDTAALDITGDIDLRADATPDTWRPASAQVFVAKWVESTNNRSYLFFVNPNGTLTTVWSTNGINALSATSTVAVPITTGRLAVRATFDVDNGAAGNTTTFYTAPTTGGPWTQLGATVVQGGTTSIFASTAILEVGTHGVGTAAPLAGAIHAIEVRNGIDGTVVANPDFEYQPAGTTSFADGAGRTWTLNGTAAISTRQFVSTVDDYEFVSGMPNYYRVRGYDAAPISYVGAGAAATANNASVVPALPSGPVAGDLLVVLASIRNSGTGTVNTPTGWSLMRAFGNASLLGRRYQAGDVALTVTFSGGVANADTIAQMAALRRADLIPVTGIDQLNGSAQDIAYPALTISAANLAVLFAGWKQDDWTSVATLAGAAEIGETSTITGDDAGQVWDYLIQTAAANIVAGSFTVTGGAAAISRGAVVALQHVPYLSEQTANLTPILDRIWVKSLTRPFLNRAVTVCGWSDVDRPDRGADFDVVNRSASVAVTDLGGGQRLDLSVYAGNHADAQTFKYILASGDLLFVHIPAGCEVPGGYFRVAGSSERRPHERATSRVFTMPLVESIPPGPDVVGNTNTWAAVLAQYPTWEALLAANPTWADLLARIAPPTEVIVS